MTTSIESYTAGAGQARQANEKGGKAFKNSAKTFVDRANVVRRFANDRSDRAGSARYFEYVQKSVDLNRELLTKWAELVTSLTGTGAGAGRES